MRVPYDNYKKNERMKTINSNHIIYIVTTCIFLIFVAQGYLVMDYFSTTRSGLIRESDAILEETFKQDLNLRNKIYKHIVGEDTLKQIPPHTKANTVNFDMGFKQVSHENVLNSLELTINSFISQTVPINIRTLDSVTSTVLRSRNIKSEFDIRLIDLKSGKTLSQSKPNKGLTIFQIPSQKLNIDLDKKQALQLTLLNPFGEILKRMGLMFLSSLSLAFICLLAFRYLIKILAKQKQLVTFKNEFLSNIAHELKRPVASLTFNLDCLSIPGTQTNPQQLQTMPPNEPVVRISFGVEIFEANTSMHICIPYISFENIIDKLSIKSWFDMERSYDENKYREMITDGLVGAEVALTVEMGKTVITVDDFLHLETGDIIQLDIGTNKPMKMYIEDKVHYLVQPGIYNEKLAVQVLQYLEEDVEI